MTTTTNANADRLRLLQSANNWSSIDDVTEAIVEASGQKGWIYIERAGDTWRWSPATKGGPYPLLRIVAQFLDVSHYEIAVPCRETDGFTVLLPENASRQQPDASTFVEFARKATESRVRSILSTLQPTTPVTR